MSKPYPMPSLGAGMEAGTVVEWYVEPGQRVARGDVVGVVDTEKGAIEIEVWEDAQVVEVVAPPGSKVPVGEPLLLLDEVKGEGDEAAEAPTPATAKKVQSVDVSPDAPGAPDRIRASPLARKVAESLGVKLEEVQGTGPGGAISRQDVEALAGVAEGKPATAVDEPAAEAVGADVGAPDQETGDGEDRHAAMRKAIAAAMARSKREIPHYYLAHTLSMEPALAWLAGTNRNRSPSQRILLAALYLKAVAGALAEFPEFNGFWEDDGFRPAASIHPGLAISLRGGGLVAPAIHNVPDRSLEELTGAIRDVVQRSRAGRLRGSEVTDPTVTVTSLGDRGVDTVFGVIYPPQVAIVGIGTVVERPWAEAKMVGSRRTVQLTLAADHRASDGHRGSLFLARIASLLQTPEDL